ncbi:hypothetical protein CD351_00600 [Erythrobacter sp. KY5]|uniref:hypothetical protein n=1 Tax=Erythrobacter sp. KY5 TaxID=2011159 RepID=UPI000DBF10A8|nr:hypothetical protein [Erythrobacter sp. KY5]AWW72921.1 hypothetical protein CD351_00600 [Erythrobacter sp. KY5]
MKKTISRVMVSAAAAGLVFAPIAAQANTRAADNAPVYSAEPASQPGLAREAEGENARGGTSVVLLLLAAAAAVAGIVAVVDNDDDGQSPGT